MRTVLPLACLMILPSVAAHQAHAQSPRPMLVDDLFHLQTLGDVHVSPDGASIAVVVQRAWSDPETFRPYDMSGNDHADVWMLPAREGPARNITRGADDGAGYWNPVWSPDSRRLALLSSAGGDNVRLYVWDRSANRLTRLHDRGVDLRAGTNATGTWNPVQWVDDRRLLVTVLAEGEQPLAFRLRRQSQHLASHAWMKAAHGRQPTASILEGGMVVREDEPASQLLLIDVPTGQVQLLVQANVKHVLLSPDRARVAVIAQSPRPGPTAGAPLIASNAAPSRLGIVSLQPGSAVRWVEGVFNPVVDFGPHPHRWSPSGSALAVIASEGSASGAAQAAFVISPTDLSVRKVSNTLIPSALAWSSDDRLVVRARARDRGERSDWWSVPNTSGEPRNLTSGLTTVPPQLMRTRRAYELIGLADEALWIFDPTSAHPRNLLEASPARVSALVWPAEEKRASSPLDSMIVRGRDGDAETLFRLDLSAPGVDITRVAQPAESSVVAYDSARNLSVFAAPQHPDGSFLWTGTAAGRDVTERMALNRRLAEIADAERVLIDYVSADGEPLRGLLLLPVGYQRGKTYSLVVWVYPGLVIRDTAMGFWVNKNQAHQDNLHILTGQGYAVLIPSMPTKGVPRDPYRELPGGVLPAIDRAIELGIADGERVGVIGQSAGGFATFGLITQTTRFKAAVAISGYADLISNYGTFGGNVRYTDGGDEKLVQARFSEGPIIGLGAPPWEDSERYVRNSPIFFLDRVQTPLLIVHGDIDYVPLQQAEEVFTGLYRLGKRVRFVRYWGESHGTDSAANVRDRWRQILQWLEAYLRADR